MADLAKLTDEEVDRYIAENVMGWTLVTREINSDSYPMTVSWYETGDGTVVFRPASHWQPTHNDQHLMMVLKRIAKMRGCVALTIFDYQSSGNEDWYVEVGGSRGSKLPFGRATCLAIVYFLDDERERKERRESEIAREKRIRAEMGEE